MAKNFFYRVVCVDGKGWDDCYDGLWGESLCEPEDRIFATAKRAWRAANRVMDAGCWDSDVPVISVEKCSVYEACWMDPETQQYEIDAIVEIHGGDIKFNSMPPHVRKFLTEKFSLARDAFCRESANLAGASSATFTAAMIAARFQGRVAEIARSSEVA